MQSVVSFLEQTLQRLAFRSALSEVLRYMFPALALMILIRCAVSLLLFPRQPEIWAWLTTPSGDRLPIKHWETLLGRGKGCDVQLDYPSISRSHAVLTRYDDGSWSVSDVGSRGGIRVNGKEVSFEPIRFGDVLSLADVEFTLIPITKEQEQIQAEARTRKNTVHPGVTLLLLTVFQILTGLSFLLAQEEQIEAILLAFVCLIGMEWVLYFSMRLLRRKSFDVESLAFFLTTMGICVVASSSPEALKKEMLAIAAGIVLFVGIGWSLRNLERAKVIRYLASAFGIALLALNLVLGTEKFGAKNWLSIGGISFQPSELVKLCFIFAGASSLHRLMAKRNLILFIGYSAAICACLAMMNDFGTAIIFFVTFLVIAFMRSGDFATIALACTGTGFAGLLVLRFKPYAMYRFAAWRHVWEYAQTTGYSQTRAMMCLASGGLFGLGAGRGWLHYVGAADTDLVFAFVAEEWGLLLAVLMVAAVVILAAFVVRSAPMGRSSFLTIGACASVTIMVIQTILNVFGTVDILPLTGVTFPFVSNGGSSMLCVWGLLAFIKAGDTRQNASFAVRLPGKRREKT